MSVMNRLLWKCRRGTLELDLVLQRFLERDYATLDVTSQQAFEDLLEAGDEDLWAMVNGEMPSPSPDCEAVISLLRAC